MEAILTTSGQESTILGRAIDPQQGNWSPQVARAILSIALATRDQERMNQLAAKSNAGTLDCDEEVEIEAYRQAVRTLDLLKAKARISLQQASNPE